MGFVFIVEYIPSILKRRLRFLMAIYVLPPTIVRNLGINRQCSEKHKRERRSTYMNCAVSFRVGRDVCVQDIRCAESHNPIWYFSHWLQKMLIYPQICPFGEKQNGGCYTLRDKGNLSLIFSISIVNTQYKNASTCPHLKCTNINKNNSFKAIMIF